MNQELIEFLKKLLAGNGGNNPGQMSSLMGPLLDKFGEFNNLESLSKATQGNVDPARDITPYKVNSFQGYLKKGGNVDGGDKPKPIYVTDPNDPRYRAYQDSLLSYNNDKINDKLLINLSSVLNRMQVDSASYAHENKHPVNYNLATNDTGTLLKTFVPEEPYGITKVYDTKFRKPTQPVILARDKVNISELPPVSINQLISERPLPEIKVKNGSYEDGYLKQDWTGVPNLKILSLKSKKTGRLEPVAIENSEGKRINYKKYKDKPLPKGFQYANTSEMKDGGSVNLEQGELQKLMQILPVLPFLFPGNDLLPSGIQNVKKGGVAQMPFGGPGGKVENTLKSIIGLTGPVGAAFGAVDSLFSKGRNAQDAWTLYQMKAHQEGLPKDQRINHFAEFKRQLRTGEIQDPRTDPSLSLGQLKTQGTIPGSPGATSQWPGAGTPGAGWQAPQGSLFNAINQQPTNDGLGNIFGALQAFGQQAQPQWGQTPGFNPANSGATLPGYNMQNQSSNPLAALSSLLQGSQSDASGGIGGGLQSFLQTLLQGRKKGGFVFEEGGEVQGPPLIPIQTEKVNGQPEMIIHLDGTITPVNAKKRHSQMDDDEVTDIVPEGSYIASADKSIKMKKDKADDILLGIKAQPYKEMKQGKLPEEINFSSLWGGSTSPKTPAELAELLMKKYNIIDRELFFEHGDIFTQQTNEANLEGRTPYIQEIIKFNESKRKKQMYETVDGYGKGGIVKKMPGGGPTNPIPPLPINPLPIPPNVLPPVPSPGTGPGQIPPGSFVQEEDWLTKLLKGVLGTNQPANSISPLVQAGLLSTMPTYQQGVNENIGAQSGALNQGISDFSALGNQLIQNARQSTQGQNAANFANIGLGLMNAFGKETNLPSLDLGASRSRIENFRPISGSRAAVDAAATPNYDATSIMQQLGDRSGSVLAQLQSQQQQGINQAAQNRNSLLDQIMQSKIGQLNNLDQTESVFNIGQKEKERQLREDQRNQITGTFGQGLQRNADLQSGLLGQIGGIQSQILPITTQFNLQNAGLAGLDKILGAQNQFNTYSTIGGIQSQNQTANAAAGTTGNPLSNTLGSIAQFIPFLSGLFK